MAYAPYAGPSTVADPTAVFGRRVLATLIDAALVLIPAFMMVSSTFHYLDVASLDRSAEQFCHDYMAGGGYCLNAADIDDRVYFSDGAGSAGTFYFWGAGFAMLVVLQGVTGWTVGKLVTGIRTVREDGRPPGFGKALVRWLLWAVDGFPYVVPLLGFIVGLTTTGHRRVGDMVAKTFVVRREAAGAPVVVPGLAVGAPMGGSYPPAPSGPWSTPGSTPPPPAPPMATPDPSAPQWDPQRGTYIQWDPSQRVWVQWDEAARSWSPIPGQ